MGWFWGISMGIVSNNRVRAASTIAYCVADMTVKVSIGRYLGHQHNRLSFEQYLFITVDRYLLTNAIGLQ